MSAFALLGSSSAAIAASTVRRTMPGLATSASLSLMDARAEAPMPPKTGTYLAVEDLPPPSAKPVMTVDERTKLKKELVGLRD
jgi:hypothetical protein